MLKRETIDNIIIKLQANSDNCKCIDCGSPSPTFVSISHGSFICSICAVTHTSLGSFSQVKSILCNDWTIDELKKLISGGNSALNEYSVYFGIDAMSVDIKYKTKAMKTYREMLNTVASGNGFNKELPSVSEGKTIECEEGSWIQGIFGKSRSLEVFSGIKRKSSDFLNHRVIEKIKVRAEEVVDGFRGEIHKGIGIFNQHGRRLTKSLVEMVGEIEESVKCSVNVVINK